MSGELHPPGATRLTRRKLLAGLGISAAAAPLSACSFDTGSPRRSIFSRKPRR